MLGPRRERAVSLMQSGCEERNSHLKSTPAPSYTALGPVRQTDDAAAPNFGIR
jgi:hypothetical protein